MDVLSVGLRVQLYIEEILAAFFVEDSRDTLRSSVVDGDSVSREGILICSVPLFLFHHTNTQQFLSKLGERGGDFLFQTVDESVTSVMYGVCPIDGRVL